ncbi:MAG: MotA/TolQ/ExbB proton channel family protein [Gammaproteobacteria bacterium]|jgi:biopolymer transport protein ExbB
MMNTTIKHILAFTVITLITQSAILGQELSIDEVLKKVKEGQYQQSIQNKQREKDFENRKSEQETLLKEAIAARNKEEAISNQLETQYEDNEIKITALQDTLNNRLGSLKELFGVLQQVSGDASGKFVASNVSAQIRGRNEFLDELAIKMGSSSQLASIEEIEQVWFELSREIIESGKIVKFEAEVTKADGTKNTQTVTRVGTFNLISEGVYLEWLGGSEVLAELSRQPSGRFLSTVADLESSNSDYTPFALDPTGGSILGLVVQAPNTKERIEQGGTVGYVIIVLGIIALLLSAERWVSLTLVSGKVNKQIKSVTIEDNNPLGRVLMAKEKYQNLGSEGLELKLSEAILREVPSLTRSITFIKIISVVAPLLGLLGTVTGMIVTFQAITLFGTGDPKLMAGGISSALMTTVLGLVVAIPTVMLYTWLNTKSKNILHILQEQAAGIIAERAERE